MNETWLNSKITNNQICIQEYKIDRLDRATKRKGGGVAVYVNKNLKVNAQIYKSSNISNSDIELLVLEIEQKCTTPSILMSVYRPPQGKHKEFLESTRTALNNLVGMKRSIIMIGDVNIDYQAATTASVKEFKMKQICAN